jgi:predicted TPR repeat methyltransferase
MQRCLMRLSLFGSMSTAISVAAPQDSAIGFDLWASSYEKDSIDLGWEAPHQAAEQLLPLLSRATVGQLRGLDAGCGTGMMVRHVVLQCNVYVLLYSL